MLFSCNGENSNLEKAETLQSNVTVEEIVDDGKNLRTDYWVSVTSNIVLNQNYVWDGVYGLMVNADNISIDGNGFSLKYIGNHYSGGNSESGAIGIRINGRKNITLKNFSEISGFDRGISIQGSENVTIKNCTIKNNIFSGININFTTGAIIEDCQFTNNITENIFAQFSTGVAIRRNTFKQTKTAIDISGTQNANISNNQFIGGLHSVKNISNSTVFLSNVLEHQSEGKSNTGKLSKFSEVKRIGNVGETFNFNLSLNDFLGNSVLTSVCDLRTIPACTITRAQVGEKISGSFVPTRTGLHSILAVVTDIYGNKETHLARVFVGPTVSRVEKYFWVDGQVFPTHGQEHAFARDSSGMSMTMPSAEGFAQCQTWVQQTPDELPNIPAAYLTGVDFNLLFSAKSGGTSPATLSLERYASFSTYADIHFPLNPSQFSETLRYNTFQVNGANWMLDYPNEWYFLAVKFTAGNFLHPYVRTGNISQPSYCNFKYQITNSPEIRKISNHDLMVLEATASPNGLRGESVTILGKGNSTDIEFANFKRPFKGVVSQIFSNAEVKFNSGIINGEKTFIAVPLDISTQQNSVQVQIVSWNETNNLNWSWNETALGLTGIVGHKIGGLVSQKRYRILVANNEIFSGIADSLGNLSFNFTGPLPATFVMTQLPDNKAPVIVKVAWADAPTLTLPNTTILHVTANDPDSGPQALNYTWSKIGGPGTVTFSPNGTNTSDARTTTFSIAGTYVLRVTVSDGNASITSDVSVVVKPATVTDTTGPVLEVSATIIKGSVSDGSGVSSLTVNGTIVTINTDGSWQQSVSLNTGVNSLTISAKDTKGNITTKSIEITK